VPNQIIANSFTAIRQMALHAFHSCKTTKTSLSLQFTLKLLQLIVRVIVKAVRGILMREWANLYKSMKIGTLVIFDMLCSNLPGAKANSQWCRHIRQFKMAAA